MNLEIRKIAPLLLVLGAVVCLAVFVGPAGHDLASLEQTWDLRGPRLLMGLFVGGGLALGGVLAQAAFSNPLVEPFTLGVASASGLGFAVGTLLSGAGPTSSAQFASQWISVGFPASVAFIFAIAALLALVAGARFESTNDTILSGMALSLLFSGATSVVSAFLPPNALAQNLGILGGNLGFAGWTMAISICLINFICLLVALTWKRSLDLLSVDPLLARSAGVNIGGFRRSIFFLISCLTAVNVSSAGLIGFVGLIVPHALRRFGLRFHGPLIISAFMSGGAVLVFADWLSRMLAAPMELPVGALLSLAGAPAFVLILRRNRGLG